ncbi:zinc-ribbon domain-containing protein [Symbiobacterium thermophilum]
MAKPHTCPDCGAEVPPLSPVCPSCGAPSPC